MLIYVYFLLDEQNEQVKSEQINAPFTYANLNPFVQPFGAFYSTTQPSDNGATPAKDQTIPQQQYILPHYSAYLPSAKNIESNEKKSAENPAYDQQYLLQTSKFATISRPPPFFFLIIYSSSK